MALDPAKQVPATVTQWAEPGDRKGFSLHGDALLRALGVAEPHHRVRLIAHASMAVGWNVGRGYCYNAWASRTGGWDGEWYTMRTTEDPGDGSRVVDESATWRAYPGWSAALEDFRVYKLERYAWALEILRDVPEGVSVIDKDTGDALDADAAYWHALGPDHGGYYTDTTAADGKAFAKRCGMIRTWLAEATVLELAEADAWAALQVGPIAETDGAAKAIADMAGSSPWVLVALLAALAVVVSVLWMVIR